MGGGGGGEFLPRMAFHATINQVFSFHPRSSESSVIGRSVRRGFRVRGMRSDKVVACSHHQGHEIGVLWRAVRRGENPVPNKLWLLVMACSRGPRDNLSSRN